MSDREQLEETVEQQTVALMQADCFRTELLSLLSHELQTPLQSIFESVTQLQTHRMGAADIARNLSTIERNARMQNQMIDDLVDIAKLMHGETILNVRTIDLVPIVNMVLRSLQPIATTRQIQLVSRLALNVGLIDADPERLQQVIENLLFNAIQFASAGERVEVHLFSVDATMHFSIKQTGNGIEARYLPFIFERFRRTDCHNHGVTGGVGLAIARQLVEMHGGTVSATSAGVGLGTTLMVQLPIQQTSQRLLLGSLVAAPEPLSLPPVEWGDRVV